VVDLPEHEPERVDSNLRLQDALDSDIDLVERQISRRPGHRWTLVAALELARDATGAWSALVSRKHDDHLPDGGILEPATLLGAKDCDLRLSPLTNTMPIRRAPHRVWVACL